MAESSTAPRNIAWFDFETTDKDTSKAKIVQIGLVITSPNLDIIGDPVSVLVNPGEPIPPKSTEVHGITDEMVANAPTFGQIAHYFKQTIENCDWGFYNGIKYDVPVLISEFSRVDISINPFGRKFLDVCVGFFKKEPRDLSSALKFYTGEIMEDAHDACADVVATIKTARGMLTKYDDLKSLDDLHSLCEIEKICDFSGKFTLDEDGDPTFTFGKHRGDKIKNQVGFLRWMLNQDFPKDTVDFINKFMKENGIS